MLGHTDKKDTDFTTDNYEEFYEHHYFSPIYEGHAYDIHEYISRFGWAFDQVEELAPKTLLDLGCLDGSFALTVSKNLGVTTVGVDLTVEGIELATERAKARQLPATFIQGTIEDALYNFVKVGQKFDVVTFFEVIEHIKDVQKILRLIDKVLAPGGSVLVSTPAFESPVYGLDDEANKCHVRLYTLEKEDYEKENKFGHVRKATSIYKEIGPGRVKVTGIHNHLINVRYE